MTTIRDMVRDIQREVLETDLLPTRAAELQTRLTSLLGNCLKELTDADLQYKQILRDAMRTYDAANRAKIEAETSDQYRRMREAKDVYTLCVELTRSLRAYLRNVSEELRLSR